MVGANQQPKAQQHHQPTQNRALPSHGRGGHHSRGRGGGGGGGRHHGGAAASSKNKDSVKEIRPEDAILHDLQSLELEWPLSCYGLNVSWDSGDNVLHGDFSPEELRMEAYAQIRSQNSIDGYISAVSQAVASQRQNVQAIVSNPSAAVAMAKTPRAYRLRLAAAAAPPMPNGPPPAQISHAPSAESLSNQPQQYSQAPSSFQNSVNRSDAGGDKPSDSFAFGSIPEL